jgi:hypothetical protein
MLADELDLGVLDAALGVALAVCLEVAEIADVAVAVAGRAVLFAEGVDWFLFPLVSNEDDDDDSADSTGQAR